MSQQATMLTGDGVVTNVDRSYTPQFILIGTTDTDNPVKKLEVSIGGNDFINVTGQSAVQAFSKLMMKGLLGADVKVAQIFRIANGFIKGQTCQIRLTNSGATTPAVYFDSYNKGNRPVLAGQEVIQDTDSKVFSGTDFTQLIFDATNLDYVNIDFTDGHSDKFSAVELAAMLVMDQATDADGLLAGQTVIQNYGNIASISIWTSGGAITVTKVLM